jgi:putative ATP-dependent endonuclease of the OLD family
VAARRPGGVSRCALGAVTRVSIQGYRAARELEFSPGSVCALVGEASSGKSTVLTAIWTLLEAAAPPPTIDDVSHGAPGGRIHLEAHLERGGTIFLDARPPDTLNLNRAGAPPVLFLPANLRARTLVAPATGSGAADVAELLRPPLPDHHWSAADGGLLLVNGMERVLASGLRRFVLLIEEPELYLSPHAQRHLYRVLRGLAQRGNQILYSTHAPVFLSVDRLEELALVRHTADLGTALHQPPPLPEAEWFRALSEFDSDRAELFLARAALLVEGRTEKLTFPLLFEAVGIDPDKEGIVVLECGGKGNMPLFARVCNACGVPYVIVHDRDADAGHRPVESERIVNKQIQEVAGRRRTVVLVPDFEAVSGVNTRGRSRKPHRAYRRYTGNGKVPDQLKLVLEKVLKEARS